MRDEDFGAALTLVEGDDANWSPCNATSPCEPRDWRSLYEQAYARAEQERARADAVESRVEELRRAEVDARSRAGSLKTQLDKSRNRLKAAVEETKEVRRAAKDALFFQAEVARLEKLLSQAGVESSRRSTIVSLRMEVVRLREALQASEARKDTSAPACGGNARLRKSLERTREQKDEIVALRREATALRKAQRAAQASLLRESARLGKALERSQEQKDTIKSLREQVRSLNDDIRQLHRELEGSETHKATIRRQSDEILQLHAEVRRLDGLRRMLLDHYERYDRLERALAKAELDKMVLENELARRRANKEALPELRKALKRSRRQKTTIKSLRKENARLRKEAKALQARNAGLEGRLARLRSTGAVLSKALYGRKSEKQDKPRSERKRGQQRGAPGHGRTRRPGLGEKTDRRNPPKDARVCSCCAKPYVANGERSTSVIEIEVKAHTRRIVRPRWRRGCDCASSPLEVTAPPVPRLFSGTPYGTSVWARFLFEHCVFLRPLSRIAAWLTDQGLAVSPGTLADSVKRFVPLFEPLAKAILAHQNKAALRHADETGWRVQALREKGRSSRAWLWTLVSSDAVYFHIDPSRSAEVAKALFGDTACKVFVVCDRYSAYKKLARELGGKVILCWCWAHQRRTFIECAAGQVGLTQWCRGWIERIAEIYRLNEARLEHYDPGLERQTPQFDAAQSELKKAVDGVFAHAEAKLACLPAKAREGKALRSLLNHREGLCVFVDHPQVPMDNNLAERVLRGPVIGRRLSFGSNSEDGAKFTAIMYSVVGTLSMHGIDVLRWLQAWLKACANNGGKPPHDLSPWLPWSMGEQRKRAFMTPR